MERGGICPTDASLLSTCGLFPEVDALVSENTCTLVVTVGPVLSVCSSGCSSRLPSLDKVPLEPAATDCRDANSIQLFKPRRLSGQSPGFSRATIGWRKFRRHRAAKSIAAPGSALSNAPSNCRSVGRGTPSVQMFGIESSPPRQSETDDEAQESFWSRLIDTPIMFPLNTILPST